MSVAEKIILGAIIIAMLVSFGNSGGFGGGTRLSGGAA